MDESCFCCFDLNIIFIIFLGSKVNSSQLGQLKFLSVRLKSLKAQDLIFKSKCLISVKLRRPPFAFSLSGFEIDSPLLWGFGFLGLNLYFGFCFLGLSLSQNLF